MTIGLKFTRQVLYYKCSIYDEACQTVNLSLGDRSLFIRCDKPAQTITNAIALRAVYQLAHQPLSGYTHSGNHHPAIQKLARAFEVAIEDLVEVLED